MMAQYNPVGVPGDVVSSDRMSEDDHSEASLSATSLLLEHAWNGSDAGPSKNTRDSFHRKPQEELEMLEDTESYQGGKSMSGRIKCVIWSVVGLALLLWTLALVAFIVRKRRVHEPGKSSSPASSHSNENVTLDEVLDGYWIPARHDLSWISGASGEDGLVLERNSADSEYLVVESVKNRQKGKGLKSSFALMKDSTFYVGSDIVFPSKVWPSPDLSKVLIASDVKSNWRHSFTARYWLFDVKSQQGERLDLSDAGAKIQHASWSPNSDAVVFTRDNNMFLRKLDSDNVLSLTSDGGSVIYYGVPDWVYEEEVLAGDSATWWSADGKYIAFFRTNESQVPEYPVQYFIPRPGVKDESPTGGNYPKIRQIKYPRPGLPNPVVKLQFYDVTRNEMFHIDIGDDFSDDDRLITEVLWAGSTGKLLVRESNRVSDVMRIILIDVVGRTGKTVRYENVSSLDGGWFEVSQRTTFVPLDVGNLRPSDGYLDTVIHDGYDHLAYFTPIDNPIPIILTSGEWEVVEAPSAFDQKRNTVYFKSTREGSIQRHIYQVNLDGSGLKAITAIEEEGFYDVSLSSGAGYALLSYQGPSVPWQKIISLPDNDDHFEELVEDNARLNDTVQKHSLPEVHYSTVTIDGYVLNVLERRPPNFDSRRKHPVLFYLYGGPNSQTVDKRFKVDFQSYAASALGYIVVSVDGRGTGYCGRSTRVAVRDNIGHYESHDQIEVAKIWAAKEYVDSEKIAIWGWSYGGFLALKTLEQDGGRTFRFGVAVAPVTDWRFYDSIYTERYMHKPLDNSAGYDNATISDVRSLSGNQRFLIMHGVADDNVHFQNTLSLLDKLDLAGIRNYDIHIFPDSDHSIYFHNAHAIVYKKMRDWLVEQFA